MALLCVARTAPTVRQDHRDQKHHDYQTCRPNVGQNSLSNPRSDACCGGGAPFADVLPEM
eukprot:1626844-Amphidinium_carterae.1